LGGNPTFAELLDRVRAVAVGAYAHQDLPFEKLVEELQPERDLSRQPLFQVMFGLQNFQASTPQLAGLTLSAPEPDTGMAKFDLTLFLNEDEGALESWLEYATDLFDVTTIHRLVGHFRTLLAGLVSDPDKRLPQLPLLTPAERHELVREWSHTPHDAPGDVRPDELLAAQAARRGDAIAVVSPDGRLSYGELHARADRLAAHLRSLGVGPEVLVGLF
ncbi:MAG: AMP-binding protein, partial [bacterium]|nr:AMP-binding protein [bacterium]